MFGFLRLLGWAVATVATMLALVGGAGYWLYRDVTSPGPLVHARTLVIPPHTGLGRVAALLVDAGVVRHRPAFEVGAALSGHAAVLLAGEYEFPPGVSALGASEILASGRTVKHRLTIAE